jgi:hypothetical protein
VYDESVNNDTVLDPGPAAITRCDALPAVTVKLRSGISRRVAWKMDAGFSEKLITIYTRLYDVTFRNREIFNCNF